MGARAEELESLLVVIGYTYGQWYGRTSMYCCDDQEVQWKKDSVLGAQVFFYIFFCFFFFCLLVRRINCTFSCHVCGETRKPFVAGINVIYAAVSSRWRIRPLVSVNYIAFFLLRFWSFCEFFQDRKLGWDSESGKNCISRQVLFHIDLGFLYTAPWRYICKTKRLILFKL
jgi:hypothetical protein